MDYPGDLVEGRFKARLNRFLALVDINGREAGVHVANSGRMRELLVPGYRVPLEPLPGPHRILVMFGIANLVQHFYGAGKTTLHFINKSSLVPGQVFELSISF